MRASTFFSAALAAAFALVLFTPVSVYAGFDPLAVSHLVASLDPQTAAAIGLAFVGSFRLKLNPFENVVASQTAVIPRLTLGNMYNAIVLELGGTFTQAQCTNIRLLLNGKIVWNVEGTHLDTTNNYDRLKDTATFLTMWFADPCALTQDEQQLGSLDTSSGRGIETASLEVDIGAATNPTLKAFGIVVPPSSKSDPFGSAFKAVIKNTQAPAAAGQYSHAVGTGSRAGGFVRRVSFFHANVTSLMVKRDGVNVMDDLTIAEIAYINEQQKRTAQSGMVVYDPISEGSPRDMISTLRGDKTAAPFEWLPTVSAADTVKSYAEVLTTLDRV